MEFTINGKSQADRKLLFDKLQNLQNATYHVVISKVRPTRSNNENRYYWKCIVTPLAEEFGYDRDEMHEILKHKFLAEASVLPNGEMIFYAGSSAELEVADFEAYCENIRRWALVEFNIKLRLPNETDEEFNSPYRGAEAPSQYQSQSAGA
jgi:hypothetical protein